MATGDIFKLAVVWKTVDERATFVNTFHFRQENELAVDEPGKDLVDAFENFALPSYRAMVTSIARIVQYSVYGITDPLYVYEDSPLPAAGLVSGEALPLQTSPIITWRTGLAGRSRRGRTYLPPTGESQQNGGVLLASFLDLMDDFADNVKVLNALAVNPLYSTWQLGVWSATYQYFNPVNSHISRQTIVTQRRRRAGQGS